MFLYYVGWPSCCYNCFLGASKRPRNLANAISQNQRNAKSHDSGH